MHNNVTFRINMRTKYKKNIAIQLIMNGFLILFKKLCNVLSRPLWKSFVELVERKSRSSRAH